MTKSKSIKKLEFKAKVAGSTAMPRKRFYRQRAHSNVFSDHVLEYPVRPEEYDWASHYPSMIKADDAGVGAVEGKKVEFADIGTEVGTETIRT